VKGDANSPQVLTNLPTEAVAALLVGHLGSLGIEAYISGAGTSTGWPEAASDLQVVVRRPTWRERAKPSISSEASGQQRQADNVGEG
jgi:hypothetical protein